MRRRLRLAAISTSSIASSVVLGQEAQGDDPSLTAVEAASLAKKAISGENTRPGQEPPIDAVKNMLKSILRDKNYTSEPVSYLSDFEKIVEQCSGEAYGSTFASLFYAIKQTLRTSRIFDTKNDLDLRRLQGIINGAFEGYLTFIKINIPEFMSNPNLIVSQDLSWVIEFVNKKDEIVIKLPNKTKIGKYEVLACLEFIKETTASASSALEEKEINAKKAELKRIIETVSEKLEKTYELQKAVWIGLSEAAGGLSRVKKVSDDIIEWIKDNEPEIDKKPFEDFSASLNEITTIEKYSNPLPGASVITDEMKHKLNNLEWSQPELGKEVWEFGKILSNKLSPGLAPAGFITTAIFLLTDLKNGVDGFTKQPIKSSLVGQPQGVYDLLAGFMPIIAEAVAPKEFAEEVKKAYESMFGASSALINPVGGIDFRQMNMLIQPMGSFSGLDFSPARLSSSALESMDLDKDLKSIKQMASSSILPSPQRLKEYISACIFKGKIGEKGDDFVLSMLEVFQLQAEEGIESAPEEREAVVMADTRSYCLPQERLASVK